MSCRATGFAACGTDGAYPCGEKFKRVDRVIAVIRKLLMSSERRFRGLNTPELMKGVSLGAVNEDVVIIEPTPEKVASWSRYARVDVISVDLGMM